MHSLAAHTPDLTILRAVHLLIIIYHYEVIIDQPTTMEFTEKEVVGSWDVPCDQAVIWLSEILKKTVESVTAAPLISCMSLGTLQVLTVVFDINGKRAKTTLVLKRESANSGANTLAAKAKCFAMEHAFYTTLAAKCTAKVPRCFYSSLSPEQTSATLLLEHVVTATPGDTHDGLTLNQLKAAAVELGKFHGSFYNDEEAAAAVKTATEHMAVFDGAAALKSFMAMWSDVLAPFEDESGTNAVKAVFEHCANHPDNWKNLLDTGVPSVVHGDFKGTNLMLGSSAEDRATILDFQTLYAGGDCARFDDLSYLLVGSADHTLRVANEKDIIKCYRDSFSAAIPPDNRYEFFPSEDEMYLYYKMATQGMVYRCLMFTLFLSGASPEACRAQLSTLVTRTTLAIIDHGLHISLCIGRTK